MDTSSLAAGGDQVGGFAGLAAGLINTLSQALGGPGAAIANGLDSIFPFLPSEVILPLVGVSVSQGHLTFVGAILWTTLGSAIGGLIMYYIGALLGRERTRRIFIKIPLISAEDIDKTEAWFAKHGTKAVFFGRMLPLFRGLISIPAGIERMSLGVFITYTTLGSLIWNTAFLIAGYQLGENWYLAERYFAPVSIGIGVLVALAIVYFIVSRLAQRRRAASGQPANGESASGEPASGESASGELAGSSSAGASSTSGNSVSANSVSGHSVSRNSVSGRSTGGKPADETTR